MRNSKFLDRGSENLTSEMQIQWYEHKCLAQWDFFLGVKVTKYNASEGIGNVWVFSQIIMQTKQNKNRNNQESNNVAIPIRRNSLPIIVFIEDEVSVTSSATLKDCFNL